MKTASIRAGLAAVLLAGAAVTVEAHDALTTSVNWSQTVSRIVYERCASCHRDGGTAFSLTTYAEARPWAVAIRDEIFARTMPPWGAVKGFGEFRNDRAMSPSQMNLMVSWIEGGAPEGDPENVPELPEFPPESPPASEPASVVRNGATLENAIRVDGLFPRDIPDGGSYPIVAELPDGRVEPLVWLYEYRNDYGHAFLLETPLELPAGTVIRGIPAGSSLALMPRPAGPDPGD